MTEISLKLVCLFLFVLTGCNALRLRGSSIVDDDGSLIEIRGMNYFGFNNGQTMLDGLWSNNPLSGDFATVVRRQKLLGFNAVRLPFSFKDFELAPRSFVHQGCPLPSDEEVAASVTPPGSAVRGPAPRLPKSPPASSYAGDVCNAYLPASSVRERFLWVAEFYARNGFVVLVDNHLREDQTALEDEDTWVASWASLAKDMFSRPALKAALIFDILNEPDNFGMQWDKLGPMYLRAMSAIDQSTAGEAIFGIEGTGQSGLNANWGDGFATTKINELGLSDPRPFFDALLKKPYANRVILAPHVYPPSVTNNENAATGNALYDRLDTSFGTKQTNGYCDGSVCQKFPILIGEFGSKLEAAKDLESLGDLATYLKDGNMGWFWWSWNANSGDTGGLVSDDWLRIQWKKIDYLRTIGLYPWAAGGDSPPVASTPSTPSTTPDTPSPSPSPKPQPSTSPSPSPSPSKPSGAQDPKPSRSPCQVKIKTENSWSSGDSVYNASFRITIKNKGSRQVTAPWKLKLGGGPKYSKVRSSWGWDPSLSANGRSIRGVATMEYLSMDPKGGEASVGVQVSGMSKRLRPKKVRLNGVRCRLV